MTFTALRCPLIVLGLLSAIPTAAEPISSAPTVAAPAGAPKVRLPASVRPTRYTLDLRLVPDQERFKGSVEIDLQLRAPTSVIWLHGVDLEIQDAALRTATARLTARAASGPDGFLALRLPRAVPAGKAHLHIAYLGKASDKEAAGLFRRQEGGRWYALTQFEATDARRAFPCFDEPGFKTPWQVTLHVPRGDLAVSNAPETASTNEPDGMKAIRFAVTPPLPSYLVAFAAGPFDVVDLGRVGRKHTPVRILTLRGKGAQARVAARTIPQLLTRLEEYFGEPYPYPKLDHLAVPISSGFFGAMENAGLIIYDAVALIEPPDRETPGFIRGVAAISGHEMAHQWVGDLVTMRWWDDIWLNEGFATWLQEKMVHRWKPEWDPAGTEAVRSKNGAMNADRLAAARRIREPITSLNDIENAFDGITYQKGAALLNMAESWLGEATFRNGVRQYLHAHARGSATSTDFVRAMSAAAGRDVAPVFSSFLDQTGTPLVSVALLDEPGRPARLRLSQSRYLPLGSTAAREQTWHVPMRIRYDDGGGTGHLATVLTAPITEISLGSADHPRTGWW